MVSKTGKYIRYRANNIIIVQGIYSVGIICTCSVLVSRHMDHHPISCSASTPRDIVDFLPWQTAHMIDCPLVSYTTRQSSTGSTPDLHTPNICVHRQGAWSKRDNQRKAWRCDVMTTNLPTSRCSGVNNELATFAKEDRIIHQAGRGQAMGSHRIDQSYIRYLVVKLTGLVLRSSIGSSFFKITSIVDNLGGAQAEDNPYKSCQIWCSMIIWFMWPTSTIIIINFNVRCV